jgi:prepilin-type N-terminal cleavage/methylation domain-containing protein
MRRNRQAGFTMIELLVTLVITVTGLMGLVSAHRALSTGSANSGRSQEAVTVGTQVMEQLRGTRPADLGHAVMGAAATPPYTNDDYATIAGRNGVRYGVEVQVTAAADNLWRIRVVVGWSDDDGTAPHAMAFELLRTSREAL